MRESWTVEAPDEGLRLDKFLADARRLGSRARVAAALSRGKIFLNDAEATSTDAARRVARGDVVRVWMDRPGTSRPRRGAFEEGDLRIVHEDDDLVVVDKPPGLLACWPYRSIDARAPTPSSTCWLSTGDRGASGCRLSFTGSTGTPPAS